MLEQNLAWMWVVHVQNTASYKRVLCPRIPNNQQAVMRKDQHQPLTCCIKGVKGVRHREPTKASAAEEYPPPACNLGARPSSVDPCCCCCCCLSVLTTANHSFVKSNIDRPHKLTLRPRSGSSRQRATNHTRVVPPRSTSRNNYGAPRGEHTYPHLPFVFIFWGLSFY